MSQVKIFASYHFVQMGPFILNYHSEDESIVSLHLRSMVSLIGGAYHYELTYRDKKVEVNINSDNGKVSLSNAGNITSAGQLMRLRFDLWRYRKRLFHLISTGRSHDAISTMSGVAGIIIKNIKDRMNDD